MLNKPESNESEMESDALIGRPPVGLILDALRCYFNLLGTPIQSDINVSSSLFMVGWLVSIFICRKSTTSALDITPPLERKE